MAELRAKLPGMWVRVVVKERGRLKASGTTSFIQLVKHSLMAEGACSGGSLVEREFRNILSSLTSMALVWRMMFVITRFLRVSPTDSSDQSWLVIAEPRV